MHSLVCNRFWLLNLTAQTLGSSSVAVKTTPNHKCPRARRSISKLAFVDIMKNPMHKAGSTYTSFKQRHFQVLLPADLSKVIENSTPMSALEQLGFSEDKIRVSQVSCAKPKLVRTSSVHSMKAIFEDANDGVSSADSGLIVEDVGHPVTGSYTAHENGSEAGNLQTLDKVTIQRSNAVRRKPVGCQLSSCNHSADVSSSNRPLSYLLPTERSTNTIKKDTGPHPLMRNGAIRRKKAPGILIQHSEPPTKSVKNAAVHLR